MDTAQLPQSNDIKQTADNTLCNRTRVAVSLSEIPDDLRFENRAFY